MFDSEQSARPQPFELRSEGGVGEVVRTECEAVEEANVARLLLADDDLGRANFGRRNSPSAISSLTTSLIFVRLHATTYEPQQFNFLIIEMAIVLDMAVLDDVHHLFKVVLKDS